MTVKRCKTILSMVFDKAIANELITINPVKYAGKFHVSHKKQEPYTLDEMETILKYTTGWFNAFMYLAFTTGMRPGELIGLKWNDIDFNRGVIHLQRSISKGIVTEDTYTKNHNRMVIVPSDVLSMIKKLNHDYEWVFPNPDGNAFYESKSITKGYFEPFCEEFNVEYKGLKATRHTYISIMRNGGVSQEFILDIVGHSKIVSDKHYYQNQFTTQKQDAVNNVFSDLLKIKRPS
jgi:integrase